MNDSDFMLMILSDGEEHSTLEIIQRSIRSRGCGITPHSRASDLRKRGHRIDCDHGGTKNGRPVWIYRLVSLSESAGIDGAPTGSPGREPALSLSEPSSLSERGGVGAAAMSGSRTSEPERPLSESELVPLFEVEAPQRKPAWG